jgi:hypothetical protein
MPHTMTPERAHEAILRGVAPDGLIVEGDLSFSPYREQVPLRHLPANLQVHTLELRGCGDLRALPKGLRCRHLSIRDSALAWLPKDLEVSESLKLTSCFYLKSLPFGLKTRQITLKDCKRLTHLPSTLHLTRDLAVTGCENLQYLPTQLILRSLDISGSVRMVTLPFDLQVSGEIKARGCVNLQSIPPVAAETLELAGCTSLRELPDGLPVRYLSVDGCTELDHWPDSGFPRLRRLSMRGCRRLRSLPSGLRQIDQLDVRDCTGLESIPQRLRVTGSLDIGGLSWHALPLSSRGFRLRWNGVAVSGHIIFHPASITVDEILTEDNVEVRRMMLERMGIERFVESAKADVLHQDEDAGGTRQLLVVPLPHDEALVCLSVRDPSTGRRYLIRVPPRMRDCHQAAAWIAGFEDPDDYHPVLET